MVFGSEDAIKKVTTQLMQEISQDVPLTDAAIIYRPIPHSPDSTHPTWRVRLEPVYDSRSVIGLDINGEVMLGREQSTANSIVLFDEADAEQLGVSRQHAVLRPTDGKLYILDLGSTNGTWLNGRSIGVNMPYSLSSGDIVRLGRLEFAVKILNRPHNAPPNSVSADLADSLPNIAKAILAQLDLKDVLKQAIDMTLRYVPSDEVTLWLVDEQTGELFLEAGQYMQSDQITRLKVNDTLAGKVVKTGKPLRANRQDEGGQIKLQTGYMVEGVIYVPLNLGGVTFGVLSAVHREPGKSFTSHDEKTMLAIADLTAVAVQNARVHHITQHTLNYRTSVLSVFHSALSYDARNLVKSMSGYAGMLQTARSAADDETTEITADIVETSDRMARLVSQLVEIASLTQDASLQHHMPTDLVEVVSRSVEDLHPVAQAKSVRIDFQVMGEPYLIIGDPAHLYRSVFNLMDNAIKFSPEDTRVSVALIFWNNEVLVRVRDMGPGIPENDLPYLFDGYFRSSTDGLTSAGLGLELVRATVEAHRGTVRVRNAEDRGAEFIIMLPASLRVKYEGAEQ